MPDSRRVVRVDTTERVGLQAACCGRMKLDEHPHRGLDRENHQADSEESAHGELWRAALRLPGNPHSDMNGQSFRGVEAASNQTARLECLAQSKTR